MKKYCCFFFFFVAFTLSLIAQNPAENEAAPILKDVFSKDNSFLQVKVDMRTDYQIRFSDKIEEQTFRAQTFKLVLEGDIVQGIRYRLRHRLNKSQGPMRDNYGAATDMAYLEFDIGKQFSIRAGKQIVAFGTMEFDYNPADVYLFTMCNDDLPAYATGVMGTYEFLGQRLNLQLINSDKQFTSVAYEPIGMAGLLLWEGSFFKDVLKTRYSYGLFQHNANKFYNWITLGTQLNIHKFTAEFDAFMGERQMDYGSVVGNPTLGVREVRDGSYSVNLKYDFGVVRPQLKCVYNKREDKLSGGYYDSKGIQAVAEIFPFKKPLLVNLRFHAMYSFLNTKFHGVYSALGEQNQNTILVGTRWFFRVL